jgi:pyridinium-3,5-biscarboxylic acid mononucleotide synthase
MKDLKTILGKVQAGKMTAGQAFKALDTFEKDLGFAKVDTDRQRRRGFPEVIFCQGKTADQIIRIMSSLASHGQDVFATRCSEEQYREIAAVHTKARYDKNARIVSMDVGSAKKRQKRGKIAVICAGTSDIPVAEEAALTAERLGANVERIFDVGVAGLHRLMKHLPILRKCRAVVVVAGMEGALPSVVGGLIDKPIIAVPTSIGYGTNLGGITALLAMLNTCVPGISVVNIDNGFGAGVAAALINRTV